MLFNNYLYSIEHLLNWRSRPILTCIVSQLEAALLFHLFTIIEMFIKKSRVGKESSMRFHKIVEILMMHLLLYHIQMQYHLMWCFSTQFINKLCPVVFWCSVKVFELDVSCFASLIWTKYFHAETTAFQKLFRHLPELQTYKQNRTLF